MHDLVRALFRNTVSLREDRTGLARFVASDDFGMPLGFFNMIRLRFIREGRVIQHFEDMKNRQPQVEAICVFPPYEACSVLEKHTLVTLYLLCWKNFL